MTLPRLSGWLAIRARRSVIIVAAAMLMFGLGGWSYLEQQQYQKYLAAGSTIGSFAVGDMERNQLAKFLAEAEARAKVTLELDGRTVTYPVADTGASYNLAAAQQLADDQGRQPFFLQWFGRAKQLSLPIKLDEAKLAAFSERFAREQSHARLPASFSLDGNTVVVKEGHLPTTYQAQAVIPALRQALSEGKTTVTITADTTKPANSPQQLAAAQTALQRLVDTNVGLQVANTTYPSTSADRFGWLATTEQTSGDIVVAIDTAKLRGFVDGIAKRLYIAPTTTTITLLDDVEQSRLSGKPGTQLPLDAPVSRLKTALEQHQPGVVMAATSPVAPPIRYNRTYSRSAKGVGLLMRDFANERNIKLGIAMTDLGGSISASYNAGSRFVTASIFKAFLAYAILNKVESGALSFGSVSGYIDPMIVRSDNATAITLHQMYGYTAIDPFLHAQGFTNTYLNNYNAKGQVIGDKYTTPADVAALYSRLANGTLLNGGHTSYLIDLMKRQVYRAGLPKGSSPSAVADKVGFLGPWIHDAGIVYAPKGTYVLVVLTNGGTWADIAELSRRIYRLYNQ